MNFKFLRKGVQVKTNDLKLIKKIKKDLTFKKIEFQSYGPPPEKFPLYRIKKNNKIITDDQPEFIKLIVPRYYALDVLKIPYSWEKVLSPGETINCKFKGTLREMQQNIVNELKQMILKKGGGILCVPPGTGKTVMAINLITLFNLKTLVIIHNKDLLNQWKSRIKQFSNCSIGTIRQNKVDIEGKQIVLGMLQSISSRKYNKDIYKPFGFVIVDECHHIGARTYSRALFKCSSPLMLGLSATPERQDGLDQVYYCTIGPILIKKRIKREITVHVDNITLASSHSSYEYIYMKNGKANVSAMITALTENIVRTKWIAQHVNNFRKEGRNILVLTARRKHAKELSCMIPNSGIIIGQMKDEEVQESLKCQIIIGTYSSVSEGFDCSRLDTLIMATPQRTIEQTVGRILRKTIYKNQPRIVDIEDSINVFKNQSSSRRGFYKKQTYPNYTIKRWFYDLDNMSDNSFGVEWNKRKITKKAIDQLEDCIL